MDTEKCEHPKCYGAEKMWEAIEYSFNNWRKQPDGETLRFHPEQREEFINTFINDYNIIKNEFMISETAELDAHKQAAILIDSALQAKVVTQTCEKGKIALGPYAILLDVALSYMVKCINERIKKIGSPIKEFKLPRAFTCETTYFDIMRRLLYYEDGTLNRHGISYDMRYNILEWSDRFFLLEYITLLENGIDPLLVKDSFWE